VSPQTPPTFLLHTAEDQPVPAQNSLSYASALLKAGVPVELHVFEAGPHGIGLGQGRPGADAWPKLCAQWLRNRKFIGE
jgi:acetyl esterase/lipase